jgi:hypothetical protein
MTDEQLDEALRGYEVPPPPEGLARRVASEVLAGARPQARRARWRWVVAAAAVGAVVVLAASSLRRVTAGERAPARRETIALGGRAILVAEAGSLLRWRQEGRTVRVEQPRGEVFYRVERGPFAVATPGGTVEVRGTCFRVEVQDMKVSPQALTGAAVGAVVASVLVTVYEGRVRVASAGGAVEVAAGETAVARPGSAPVVADDRAPPPEPQAQPQPARRLPTERQRVLADREMAALRARVADQERELAQLRGALPPDKVQNLIDPTHEELVARAQRCEIGYRYPPLDGPPATTSDRQARKLGLSDTERAAVDEVLGEIHSEVPATLRKLYAEMSGDTGTAERLSPSTLLTEILQKAPDDMVQQGRTRIAQERAGLAPPPTSLAAVPAVERALRLMVGMGDDFERRLGERLGPERARALRSLRESWGNSATMSGCKGSP